MNKHSPLPFLIAKMPGDLWDDRLILDKDGVMVARVSNVADADLILLAVNSHKDLTDAMLALLSHIEWPGPGYTKARDTIQRAKAALDKAKGITNGQ